jgi:hypothetical protein
MVSTSRTPSLPVWMVMLPPGPTIIYVLPCTGNTWSSAFWRSAAEGGCADAKVYSAHHTRNTLLITVLFYAKPERGGAFVTIAACG